MLDVVLEPAFTWAAAPIVESDLGSLRFPLALHSKSYKSRGAMDVDFTWNYFGKTKLMRMRAGFMGVAQDKKTLTLKPRIAWQVMHVKISPEEKLAVDFLSQLEALKHNPIDRSWSRMNFNPETKMISFGELRDDEKLDSRFWQKAFPLMMRLKSINVSYLIDGPNGLSGINGISEIDGILDPKETQAICKAMLSAKSVTTVIVPADLDKASLSILQSRKDWKIETAE